MKIVIEEKKIHGIPTLNLYNSEDNFRKPAVILLHGLNGSKENYLSEAYKFAKDGFYAISFDAFNHGEIISDEFEKLNFWEKASYLPSIILETTSYLDKIILECRNNDFIDFQNISLIGFSMGGSSIYNYLCNNKNQDVKAAVSICTSPVWSNMFKSYKNMHADISKHFNKLNIDDLEEIEPIKKIDVLNDLPFLMINVEGDETAPIEDVRKSYKRMKENYSNSELVNLLEYKGINHQLSPQMMNEARTWIKKYI
jgi:uncharacterized protein